MVSDDYKRQEEEWRTFLAAASHSYTFTLKELPPHHQEYVLTRDRLGHSQMPAGYDPALHTSDEALLRLAI